MRAGFTLIELLVVIAIIAILAAIIFPILSQAKQAGYRASCLGNLKQIGAAMNMYQQDWDNDYPSVAPYPGPEDEWHFATWIRMLLSGYYSGSRKVFNCPGAANPFEAGSPKMKIGYGFNEYIYFRDNPPPQFYDENMIPRPKVTLLLGDGYENALIHDWDGEITDSYNSKNYGLPRGMLRSKYADWVMHGKLSTRHGGSNILFCDLHAGHMKDDDWKAEDFPGVHHKTTCREWPVIYPGAKPYR